MISVRNVKKYLADHRSEIGFWHRRRIAFWAWWYQDSRGIIGGGVAHWFMGNLARKFFDEVTTNRDHIQMGLEDMQADPEDQTGGNGHKPSC